MAGPNNQKRRAKPIEGNHKDLGDNFASQANRDDIKRKRDELELMMRPVKRNAANYRPAPAHDLQQRLEDELAPGQRRIIRETQSKVLELIRKFDIRVEDIVLDDFTGLIRIKTMSSFNDLAGPVPILGPNNPKLREAALWEDFRKVIKDGEERPSRFWAGLRGLCDRRGSGMDVSIIDALDQVIPFYKAWLDVIIPLDVVVKVLKVDKTEPLWLMGNLLRGKVTMEHVAKSITNLGRESHENKKFISSLRLFDKGFDGNEEDKEWLLEDVDKFMTTFGLPVPAIVMAYIETGSDDPRLGQLKLDLSRTYGSYAELNFDQYFPQTPEGRPSPFDDVDDNGKLK
ncbi:hypothetical protein B0T25DRAFT_275155 [Lasiosphaeria hispida]|uniref:Uncharacterized protein n=1 Tax=Lasiosphaeria hispida TaxID=260671 RepID=A0AAJ0HBQ8_9PEZI|nr:hypothetical protein B0T25DRAFT_275155 [Lasiosphaeria hispida]